MKELPPEAMEIDPRLCEAGADCTFQRLVFAKVYRDENRALLVAQLVAEHPERIGLVGRFYGTRLDGLDLGEQFRPWASKGLGEMRWDPEAHEWQPLEVQTPGAAA